MHRFSRIVLTLALLFFCLMPLAELQGKGGRGGMKGGGRGGHNRTATFRGRDDGSPSGVHKTYQRQTTPALGRTINSKATSGNFSAGDQPWSKDVWREQRKLDHRTQVADHLREISELNGNEQLQRVADNMQQRAQARMALSGLYRCAG